MKPRLLKDSTGKKSWHLTLAIPNLIIASLWFFCGGIDLTLPGGYHITTATKSAAEWAMFATPWLAAMGARDWMEKTTKQGGPQA
jgi:hypothetical protein